jgi:cytochrome c oxidase subunit 4
MADYTHTTHDAHGPHVLPLKVYFGVYGALILGTALTVAAAQVHIGPFNVPIMLLIAVAKGTLVALFFMHLLYDEKFNTIVLLFGIVFVGIFFAFTLADTATRGTIDPIEQHSIAPDMDRPTLAGFKGPILHEEHGGHAAGDAHATTRSATAPAGTEHETAPPAEPAAAHH